MISADVECNLSAGHRDKVSRVFAFLDENKTSFLTKALCKQAVLRSRSVLLNKMKQDVFKTKNTVRDIRRNIGEGRVNGFLLAPESLEGLFTHNL